MGYFPGVGTFEQLFGPGRGEFEHLFSKNSSSRGLPGGDVEASIWMVYYYTPPPGPSPRSATRMLSKTQLLLHTGRFANRFPPGSPLRLKS